MKRVRHIFNLRHQLCISTLTVGAAGASGMAGVANGSSDGSSINTIVSVCVTVYSGEVFLTRSETHANRTTIAIIVMIMVVIGSRYFPLPFLLSF